MPVHHESPTTLFLSIGVQYPDFFLACGAIFFACGALLASHNDGSPTKKNGIALPPLRHNSMPAVAATDSAPRCPVANDIFCGFLKSKRPACLKLRIWNRGSVQITHLKLRIWNRWFYVQKVAKRRLVLGPKLVPKNRAPKARDKMENRVFRYHMVPKKCTCEKMENHVFRYL